jgi:hypothetical protein
MHRMVFTLAAVSAALSMPMPMLSAGWQDPLAVSPEAYRLAFENAWVKVVRVTYGPKAVLPPHFHTELASAYVYLNDGGPIVFRHEGLPYAAATRPATKAGSFRLYKGLAEVHSVENPTATPSDFLRVEFKTEPLEEAALKGKFFRDEPAPAATTQRLQFENAQVRILRLSVARGASLRVTAGDRPALLVALTPTAVEPGAGGNGHSAPGSVVWLDPGQAATVQAMGGASDVLRFDFKTGPRPAH